MDEYQAFEFDLAMAFKGYLRDKENDNSNLNVLLEGMRGIMLSNGGKPRKLPALKPLIKPPVTEQTVPLLDDILRSLGGAGVAIEEST